MVSVLRVRIIGVNKSLSLFMMAVGVGLVGGRALEDLETSICPERSPSHNVRG
jgi:hypothetical protein